MSFVRTLDALFSIGFVDQYLLRGTALAVELTLRSGDIIQYSDTDDVAGNRNQDAAGCDFLTWVSDLISL